MIRSEPIFSTEIYTLLKASLPVLALLILVSVLNATSDIVGLDIYNRNLRRCRGCMRDRTRCSKYRAQRQVRFGPEASCAALNIPRLSNHRASHPPRYSDAQVRQRLLSWRHGEQGWLRQRKGMSSLRLYLTIYLTNYIPR